MQCWTEQKKHLSKIRERLAGGCNTTGLFWRPASVSSWHSLVGNLWLNLASLPSAGPRRGRSMGPRRHEVECWCWGRLQLLLYNNNVKNMKGNICISRQQSSSENNTDHRHNILTSHIALLNNNIFSPLSKNVSILEYYWWNNSALQLSHWCT